jgi:two-component system chemotaxis response regulator CheY
MSIPGICRILVVDDDRFMRTTIKLVLRAVGRFDVGEADDGDTALVATDEFKPDVVLCDISMPRMGGLEFVANLRQHPVPRMRDTPVLILTGMSDEGTVRDAVRLQINGFLVKPVSPKALRAYLQKILGSRGLFLPA